MSRIENDMRYLYAANNPLNTLTVAFTKCVMSVDKGSNPRAVAHCVEEAISVAREGSSKLTWSLLVCGTSSCGNTLYL